MFLIKSVVFISLFYCASTQKSNKNDVIGFPEAEENPDLNNKEVRLLVLLLRFILGRSLKANK